MGREARVKRERVTKGGAKVVATANELKGVK